MTKTNYTADNAVILAAGFSSRFAPLSYETPKALLKVRGEILIERQIRQLREAGIKDIYVVTGYKDQLFQYLKNDFQIRLIHNAAYDVRNNHSSIWAARNVIHNSYICSSDNYFTNNVFAAAVSAPYYAALYAADATDEYCLSTDRSGRITGVTIGGAQSWYMLGQVFWDADFSLHFLNILERIYEQPQTAALLWEQIYMQYLDELTLYIKKYPPGMIHEFDTLDELCCFDPSYIPYRDSLSSDHHQR